MDAAVLRARARRQGRDVWLIELTDADGAAAIRLTTHDEDITYDGDTYTHHNCSVKPPSADSDGGLPACDITFSNTTRAYQITLANNDFFRKGTATIVYYNTACPGADYDDDTTVVEIVNHDSDVESVVMHCSVPKEFTEQTPQVFYGPWACSHRFKDCMCGYSGADTTCDHTRQACRDKGNVARFGAEPGLARKTVRVSL